MSHSTIIETPSPVARSEMVHTRSDFARGQRTIPSAAVPARDFATGTRAPTALRAVGSFDTGMRTSPRRMRVGDFATGMRRLWVPALVAPPVVRGEESLPLAA
jgi:hypothetical protein